MGAQIMFTRVVGSYSRLEHVVYSLGDVLTIELTNGASDACIYDDIYFA
jgi:hypothetical protein